MLITIPAFTDHAAARDYPLIVPPTPIDIRALPRNARVAWNTAGACTITTDPA